MEICIPRLISMQFQKIRIQENFKAYTEEKQKQLPKENDCDCHQTEITTLDTRRQWSNMIIPKFEEKMLNQYSIPNPTIYQA